MNQLTILKDLFSKYLSKSNDRNVDDRLQIRIGIMNNKVTKSYISYLLLYKLLTELIARSLFIYKYANHANTNRLI